MKRLTGRTMHDDQGVIGDSETPLGGSTFEVPKGAFRCEH